MSSSPSHEEPVRPFILVVDDNRGIADTLAAILTHAGYECAAAYSAEDALTIASAHPPSLLLSDISMPPGMDGYELAHEVAARFPECKVILNSARLEKILPPHLILMKPVTVDDLLSTVRGTLTSNTH